MTRNNLIKLLLVVTLCSMFAFCISILGVSMPVKAANSAEFEMLGASLRYTEETTEDDDGLGIRFGMRASESFISSATEIGFVVIPSRLMQNGAQLTVDTENAVINPKSIEDWSSTGEAEGYKRASVYVYGIPEMDMDTELTAVGYAKIDNEYVYTDTIERCMKYVAVSASCDSKESEELRSAVEKYTDKGNVAYFGDERFTNIVGYEIGGSIWAGHAVTDSEIYGETKKVVRNNITTSADDWYAVQKIKTPAVKDITSYKYFSFMIKVSENDVATVTINGAASFKPTTEWQRIVFENNNGVFTSKYGNLFGTASASANNLDGFQMIYGGNKNESSMISVYLTDMYASNTLPQVESTLPEYVMKGESKTISFTSIDANGATVDVKVSVNGQDAVSVANSSQYAFDVAGEHKFIVSIVKDEKIIYSENVVVDCVNTTGNEVLYSGSKHGVAINGISGWQSGGVSFDNSVTVPGEQVSGALKVTNVRDGAATAFSASTPSIANVLSYKYVYFDVYNPQARDVDFTIEWAYDYPVVKLLANSWNRIILLVNNNGTIYLPNAYTNQNGGNTTNTGIASGNFANVEFAAIGLNRNEYFCISNVYVSNDKPVIPNGVKYFSKNNNVAVLGTGLEIAYNGITSMVGTNVYYAPASEYNYSAGSSALVLQGTAYGLILASIDMPDVKDVSNYEYLYIDVYSEHETIKFTPNYSLADGAAYVEVENDQKWHRVVMKKTSNGNFELLNYDGVNTANANGNIFGRTNTKATVNDISGFVVGAICSADYKKIAIGNFVACNELPELPSDTVYANYSAN